MPLNINDLLITDEKKKKMAENDAVLDRVYSAFVNDGFIANDSVAGKFAVSDLLTSPDVQRFVPQVVIRIMLEAREPNIVISGLFDHIRLERGQTIQIGAIGAIAVHEIPENGEYKPSDLQMDSGDMVGFSVRKYGCLLNFTEEMIQDSQWDVMGLWMRAAGRAFARNREKRATRLLAMQGEVAYDNADPSATNSVFGVTTGRNIAGVKNGSATANDLFNMFAYLALRGFNPDTILMHPLAWSMWATDPELREIVMLNGQLASRRLPEGQPDPGWPTTLKGFGQRTKGTGLTPGITDPNLAAQYEKLGSSGYTRELGALAMTFQSAPGFLSRPLNVLVSPYLPFSNDGTISTGSVSTTTIAVLDSSMVGAFIERTPLSVEEWNDPLRDARNLKIRERFGMVIYEQGKGVVIANNIVLAKNYVFSNVNQQALAEIAERTAIVT